VAADHLDVLTETESTEVVHGTTRHDGDAHPGEIGDGVDDIEDAVHEHGRIGVTDDRRQDAVEVESDQ
jgi:hypothetical protein